MKIVCDACAAKYSIADDKVKGKVFKIRCKKCSNIIVVRGTGPGAATDEPAPAQFDQKETRVYDYGAEGDQAGDAGGDEAVWHVVIDQEQVGPVTAAEIQRRFAGGEIDAETYIWREGFADWQPLSQIDIFAALAAGGSTTAAQPPSSGEDAVASMFEGPRRRRGRHDALDPNDLFAAAAARTADDDGADDAAGDLFGGGGKAARHAEEPAAERGGKGGAAAGGDKRLRGERNENSVLFSLGNLAALASDAPRASAPSASSSSSSASASASAAASPGAAAHGGGEGSGLIDIRSMASTYLADKGSARPGGKGAIGSVDDLPVFSTAAFAEPVVIMPTGRSGGGDKKVLYALVGVVGLLAVVAVVLIVMVMGGGKKDPGQIAMTEGSNAANAASGANPGSSAGSAGSAAPSNDGGAGSAGSAAGSSDGSAGSAGSAAAGSAAGSSDGSAGSGSGAGTAAAANPGLGGGAAGQRLGLEQATAQPAWRWQRLGSQAARWRAAADPAQGRQVLDGRGRLPARRAPARVLRDLQRRWWQQAQAAGPDQRRRR